jgi:hypothetical protein
VQVWVQTSLAVVGLGVFLLAVTSLQALVLNNPAFRNPRQRRYEACKAKVMALGEGTMSRLARLGAEAGPQELREALLASLRWVRGAWKGEEGGTPIRCKMNVLHAAAGTWQVTVHRLLPSLGWMLAPPATQVCGMNLPAVDKACRTSASCTQTEWL